MKRVLLILFCLMSVRGFSSDRVLEEEKYNNFRVEIQQETKNKNKFFLHLSEDQSLFVDALWDSLEEAPNTITAKNLKSIATTFFSVVEKLRIAILKLKYNEAETFETDLVTEITNELLLPETNRKLIYTIAAHEELLLKAGLDQIISLAKTHAEYTDISTESESSEEILSETVTDLFFNTPDVTTYMDGEYLKSVKIFMFCRTNRLYPCLMVMKDINGKEVRNHDGSLWSNPVLASAKSGFQSYQRNGNTPAGIFTIDSVMPEADQQLSYGKFRRMMLNFVPKSADEVLLKSLLPKSSWDKSWWKQTLVARDIGRNLFRIHGSGRINTEPNSPYFPFMRTSGCIANKENTYFGITYKNQRDLLDSVMMAMELKPEYENEPKIKGILYILELDEKNEEVRLADLEALGIK